MTRAPRNPPLKLLAKPPETEAGFQQAVIQLAQHKGWRIAHFRKAHTRDGRVITPVAADGAGWPDLVLVGHGRIMFRELKTDTGRLSAAQEMWGMALREGRQNWDVWRPKDWQRICAELDGRTHFDDGEAA